MFPLSEWSILLVLGLGLLLSACTPAPETRNNFSVKGSIPFDGILEID